MIIGGLDVCDAFKFHRDEDTEFLGHPVVSMVSMVSSSRQWSGECGGDLRPLWVRGGEGWWIMYRWKVKVEIKEQRAGASKRVYIIQSTILRLRHG